MFCKVEIYTVLDSIHVQVVAFDGDGADSLFDPALLMGSTFHRTDKTKGLHDALWSGLEEAQQLVRMDEVNR